MPPTSGSFVFCPHCGARLGASLRGGLERPHCPQCGYVQFRNPVVGVAVALRDEGGRVLMGRRARGPEAGRWCIPCGYVEWEEEIREAGQREMLEETGLEVAVGDALGVHSNFHNAEQHTVGVWFAGEVTGGELAPADGEFTELDWFEPGEPPELAFPTDRLVLAELAAEERS